VNPVTSLSMVYLRAFARENATRPGMVRVSRKAMHLLRMHWSVCATDARSAAYDRDRATKTSSEGQDSRDGISGPQIAHVGGTV